jgi:hypothetical protein
MVGVRRNSRGVERLRGRVGKIIERRNSRPARAETFRRKSGAIHRSSGFLQPRIARSTSAE